MNIKPIHLARLAVVVLAVVWAYRKFEEIDERYEHSANYPHG